ncbi:unnamed protein product [Staurois parvus]|uniref:Uncharacterized protein n=1 Tax=Staurois parvus TaxID=386267 RepID=A0ABN9ET46_9NEOB|nr:unnamed protein product [Staurois parvus]
MHQRSNVN